MIGRIDSIASVCVDCCTNYGMYVHQRISRKKLTLTATIGGVGMSIAAFIEEVKSWHGESNGCMNLSRVK